LVRNKVVHEEEEASRAFACQRETSVLAVAVVAEEEEDSVLLDRSVCQHVPILEEGLHAAAEADLHHYTSIRVEVQEEVRRGASVVAAAAAAAVAAVAADCMEEVRHTEDVRREELHEKDTPGCGGDDNTTEPRTWSTANHVSAIPCCVRHRLPWSSVC
jgi:hypothetical protein